MWWLMLCLQENTGGEVERRGRAHSPHIHREQGVHLQVEEGQWNERQNIPFAYFLTWPAAHLQIEEVQWNEWQNIPLLTWPAAHMSSTMWLDWRDCYSYLPFSPGFVTVFFFVKRFALPKSRHGRNLLLLLCLHELDWLDFHAVNEVVSHMYVCTASVEIFRRKISIQFLIFIKKIKVSILANLYMKPKSRRIPVVTSWHWVYCAVSVCVQTA